MAVATAALSLTAAVVGLALPASRGGPLPGLPLLGLLTWTAAGCWTIAFVNAILRRRTAARPDLLVYIAALPPAVAATAWLGWAQLLDPGLPGTAAARAWAVGRPLAAVAFAAACAIQWWRTVRRPPRRAQTVALVVAGALSVLGAMVAGSTADAIGHAAVVLLYGAVGGWLLPAIRGRRRDALSAGFIASSVPQIGCQLALAAGLELSAVLLQLLAASLVTAGVVADDARVWSDRRAAFAERADAERQLRNRTAELERSEIEREAQEAMRRRAERLRQMLHKAMEVTSVGVTISNMRGEILYVNPADAKMHGYEVDELIGRDVRLYAAEGTESLPTTVQTEPWARERLNRHRDGDVFPVRLVSDRVADEHGEPIATVTICEDIRERLQVRAAIERRDRILEAVAFAAETFLAESSWREQVGDVLARLGRATRVRRVELSLEGERSTGEAPSSSGSQGSPDETLCWRWTAAGPYDTNVDVFDLGHTTLCQTVSPLPAAWEAALRAGESVFGRGPDGDPEGLRLLEEETHSWAIVPVSVQGVWRGRLALLDDDETRRWSTPELESLRTAAKTVGAAIQRHQSEEALATSEAKYRGLLENAHDLIQSVSPDGRYLFVNRAWKQALGYSDAEIATLAVWDVVLPKPGDAPRDVLDRMLPLEDRERQEAIFVAKDGREIEVEGIVTRRVADGVTAAAQGIFRDITERKAVDRMKRDFISTVSHELRTPLTSIIASLALLDSGRLAEQPDRAAELVGLAHRNGDRLLKLINNLLDLQKLAARKMRFRADPLPVDDLLREAVESLEAVAAQRQLTLRAVPPDEDALAVVADRDRLMQVLHNLLSNAIKFSADGDTIELSATHDPTTGRVALAVTDEGPGIPDDFRAYLFDQFTQADTSKTRSSGGSGLGLSIVKGLIEGMGGRVDVDSELGVGSTFRVDLPAAAAPLEPESSPAPVRV